MDRYSVMIAYHRAYLANAAVTVLEQCPAYEDGTFEIIKIDGLRVQSCAQLWNLCIYNCPTEIGIICNEKARPTPQNINKMMNLLHGGHGIVGLFRFGFFGFHKEVFRRIGLFDERYIGGWCEDNDMVLRLGEANIAYYESEEILYPFLPSAWKHDKAKAHYRVKWQEGADGLFHRQLSEETYDYDLGPSVQVRLNSWETSTLMPLSGGHLNRKMVRVGIINESNHV